MNGYELATRMLDDGIECIPLNIEKRPMLDFANVPITEEFIEYHRQEYSYCSGLGVLTRKVWCIDLDNHGDTIMTGFRSMKENKYHDELDKNAINTWIQLTPSGGVHFIFKKHEGYDYGQKLGYLKNVDIKANNNNYFVLAGSVTKQGVYASNTQEPIEYSGDFEDRIFNWEGKNYDEQFTLKHSVSRRLPDLEIPYIHSRPIGKGGRGKEAYERIISGQSDLRNNDLFYAASYAKTCGIDIEPLRVLIGTRKGKDVFTEKEFQKTVDSAKAL